MRNQRLFEFMRNILVNSREKARSFDARPRINQIETRRS